MYLKNQCVFVKHGLCPRGNKVQKSYFRAKVKVKVTMSLTLASFERASLVEYACQVSTSNGSMLKLRTDKQKTDKQTDKQTGQKQYAPIIRSGA